MLQFPNFFVLENATHHSCRRCDGPKADREMTRAVQRQIKAALPKGTQYPPFSLVRNISMYCMSLYHLHTMFVLARRLEVGEEGVAVDDMHLPKQSVPTGGFSKTTKFGPGPSPPISAITRWRDAQCPARTWHHAAIRVPSSIGYMTCLALGMAHTFYPFKGIS